MASSTCWIRRSEPAILAGFLALAGCRAGSAILIASIDDAAGAFAPLESALCVEGKRYYRGKRRLKVVADPEGSFSKVELRLRGSAASPAAQSPFLLDWDTTAGGGGDLQLKLVGTAPSDQLVESDFQVCVDNTPPVLSWSGTKEPLMVFVEDAKLELAVDAIDGVSGIRSIRSTLSVSGAPAVEASCGENTSHAICRLLPAKIAKTFKAGERDQGASLTIRAEDRAGNVAERALKAVVGTRLLWSFDTGGRVDFGVAALPDGRVAVAANTRDGSNQGHKAFLLSAEGAELCRWEPPMIVDGSGQKRRDSVSSAIVVSKDGQRVFFTTTTALVALTPPAAATVDCQLAWGALPQGVFYYSRPAVDENRVYLVDQGLGALIAFDAKSGARAGTWALPLSLKGRKVYSSPTLSADGQLYIGNEDGEVFKTQYPSVPAQPFYHTGGPFRTAVLSMSDRLALATADSFLRLLDPSGAPLLSLKASNPCFTEIGVSPDEKLLYFGATDGYLYSVSAKTMQSLARYNVGSMAGQPEQSEPSTVKPYGSPVLGPDGTVYAGCAFAKDPESKEPKPCALNALSSERLELLWSYKTEAAGANLFLGSPALAAGRIYIGSTKGMLLALDPTRTP